MREIQQPATGTSIFAPEGSKLDAANPANSADQKMGAAREKRKRIPMSIPRAKMATPEISGYHTHWINDYPGRIPQAIQAGYEFVDSSEALITQPSVSGDPIGKGTDMGSRVSIVVGANDDGSPLRAYLMKIENDLFEEDQATGQERVDNIHDAMQKGNQKVDGESAADARHRYVSRSSVKSTYSRRG